MKDKLSVAFKSTPQHFNCVVKDAVLQAKSEENNQKNTRKYVRVLAVAVALLVLIPVTVFGAVKLFSIEPKKVSNYGIGFAITPDKKVPQYMKMHIDLPKGFEKAKNTEDLKYNRSTNGEHAFSIMPMRIEEAIELTQIETDAKDIKEVTFDKHLAYKIIGTDDYSGLDRYYVWFEEANVLMLIYKGETVTNNELEDFVRGISFYEGSENDYDTFYEAGNTINITQDDKISYDKTYIELDKDEEIVFSLMTEDADNNIIQVNSHITDIRVVDSLEGLDTSKINPMYEIDEVADENLKLRTNTVKVWKNGDGINTQSELVRTEEQAQSLVLFDIELTNTSNKDVEMYIPHRLETLNINEDGSFTPSTIIDEEKDIVVSSYCDTEIFYLSRCGDEVKNFYIPTIKAGETATITVGIRCSTDEVSNAYVCLSYAYDGISSPVYKDYSDNLYTHYIFKVK